jgi:CYTH domain-containing protein/CHAD domain-containing protein
MALEIERKFLLTALPEWIDEHPAKRIEQGYIVITEEVEVRLRRIDDAPLLTVKRGHGEVREEVEVALEQAGFDALWPLTEDLRVQKRRHLVPLDELTVEVDVFEGGLEGLALAEIEFPSEAASEDFRPPDWLGEEVTGIDAYANQSLATLDRLPAAQIPTQRPHKPGGIGQAGDMSNRAQRALSRAAKERKALVSVAGEHKTEIASAIGTVAVAGAAAAGKAGLEKLREDGQTGPSRAYRLKSKEKPKQGIRRIARGRAADALEQLEDPDAGGVHEARKDLKKLRSLLRLVRADLGSDFYRTENRRFRDAGRRLSAARDADVKLETLDSLQERFAEELPADGLKDFRRTLSDERALAADAIAGGAKPVAESLSAISKGRNRVTGWKLQTQGWELVGPGLVRSYRSGRKEMKRTIAEPSPTTVHEWRKRSKDLWYQLRVLREAWPEAIDPAAEQAHELGDLLGDHHDLQVLAEDARRRRDLFPDDEGKKLVKLARRRQDELLAQAIDLGRRIYAEKPKAFGRRFEAYWHAWRPA